jgi:hypothetical protein
VSEPESVATAHYVYTTTKKGPGGFEEGKRSRREERGSSWNGSYHRCVSSFVLMRGICRIESDCHCIESGNSEVVGGDGTARDVGTAFVIFGRLVFLISFCSKLRFIEFTLFYRFPECLGTRERILDKDDTEDKEDESNEEEDGNESDNIKKAPLGRVNITRPSRAYKEFLKSGCAGYPAVMAIVSTNPSSVCSFVFTFLRLAVLLSPTSTRSCNINVNN